MRQFLKALGVWLDDPMTESVWAAVAIVSAIDLMIRAARRVDRLSESVDEAHERIDEIQRSLPLAAVRDA